MVLFVDVDLVLFQQVVEGGAADFKAFSGLGDVVAAQGQGSANGIFFRLIAGSFQGGQSLLFLLPGYFFKPQVNGGDNPFPGGSQGPADAVLELADIARPVMGAEGGDGCR